MKMQEEKEITVRNIAAFFVKKMSVKWQDI